MQVKLPELGENIESAEVIRVLVAAGDRVTAGQNVLELESEKASFPLPCPSAGRVAKILVKVGETVSIGQAVLELDEAATQAEGAPKAKASSDGKKTAPVPEPPPPAKAAPSGAVAAMVESKTPPQPGTRPPISAGPATRRLARELGVNLGDVHGSERGGRITRDDVKAFVKRRLQRPAERDGTAAPLPDFSRFGPVHRQALNKIARTAAERLSLAWRTIPHVTQHDTADVTELEAGRRRFNDEHRDASPKITMTALAIRAAVAALKAFPRFNSSLDAGAGELIVKDYIHIGIAVDTEAGLLVPVLRDADKKTLVQVAAELAELAAKARERSLALADFEGGTFTITNLGGVGGTFFSPIINYPEVAILGIGQAETQEPTKRLRLPLSLSYDHRVINGADGARFIRAIATFLSDPFRLLAAT
jgi:pyruvate dehydrogenase E2 component (dihydrolipoamide acetyltransferase)